MYIRTLFLETFQTPALPSVRFDIQSINFILKFLKHPIIIKILDSFLLKLSKRMSEKL
jgi:hypothetical protein